MSRQDTENPDYITVLGGPPYIVVRMRWSSREADYAIHQVPRVQYRKPEMAKEAAKKLATDSNLEVR